MEKHKVLLPGELHHFLKVLAAMNGKSIQDTLVSLIEHSPELSSLKQKEPFAPKEKLIKVTIDIWSKLRYLRYIRKDRSISETINYLLSKQEDLFQDAKDNIHQNIILHNTEDQPELKTPKQLILDAWDLYTSEEKELFKSIGIQPEDGV